MPRSWVFTALTADRHRILAHAGHGHSTMYAMALTAFGVWPSWEGL